MAIPPDIKIRLEQLRGEMAAKAEAQRRQQQAQANAERMSKQFVPGRANGGLAKFLSPSAEKQRMYHGTTGNIESFTESPTYLSPNPKFAAKHAKDKAAKTGSSTQGLNVMPVHVQVKNPFDYQNKDHVEALHKELSNHPDLGPFVPSKQRLRSGEWRLMEDGIVQEAIKKLGHDSFYVKENSQKNLGVYDLNKIKSATGNRGTYDTSDPDITKAKGGSVLPKEQHDENLNRFLAESAIKQRMYTGTSKDKDFSKFNVPKNGAWFTPSTEVASSYAKENDSKDLKYDPDTRGYKEINTADRVLPVYLRATKPYQITADDIKRMNVGNYKKAQSQFFDSLRAMGHDSAVFEDGTTVILEGPHQIKSAIGNRGTYDLSNPDINKAKGGEVNTPNLDTMRLALTKFLKPSKVKERVYHGTGNLENLASFDPGMTGKGNDQLGSGFYFTTHPDEASGYATSVTLNVGEGTPKLGGNSSPGVVAAHLAIRKPIKIGPKGYGLHDSNVNLSHDQVKRIMEHNPKLRDPEESPLNDHFDTSRGVTPKMIHDVAGYYTGKGTLHMLENDMFSGDPTGYRHALHNVLGYDGVIKDFGDGRKHYVAWFPEQVKSAIGNRGTYDTTNPDITMAEGGTVQPGIAKMKLALNKQGMYSPLEKAAIAVPRSKGTPAEFMAEISKQPGFRKEEVADRKISLPEQKMTKDEFLTHLQSHASPKLEEKVYHEEDEDEGDQTQYSQYKMPGGSNYREMLLKTPTFPESKNLQIMELEANIRRMNPEDYPPGYVQNMIDGVAKLKAEKAAMGDAYQSSHWRDDPNVLAHIRLSDRYAGDTGQFVVTGTKNGKTQFLFQTGIKGTPEQAQEAAKRWEAQGYQTNINQVGGGKKLLHVEEIQSDWHQEGRKKGYANPQAREQLLEQIESAKQAHQDYLNQMKEKYGGDGLQYARNMTQEEKEEARRLAGESERIRQSAPVFSNQVPDAPFKKSWHELAMKHILNHAANNGYDGIVITPGQAQADRYDLSKQISSIAYNPEEKLLDAWDHNRRQVMRREITDESQLADYIGKEAANKLLQTQPVMGKHLLEGQDLKVGGEGMKGFYDKIVPDYLNKLGKPHGAQVQMHSMPIGKPKVTEDEVINSFPGGVTDAMRSGDVGAQQYIAQKMAEANKPNMVHYFPIPDSMRQQIKNEGLPQYKRGGTVKGLDHFFQSDNSLDHFFQE